MSLNDALKVLKDHADAFRSKTGVDNSLSIPIMTDLLKFMSWDKKNLLRHTSDQYQNVSSSGWGVSAINFIQITNNDVGKTYTYAATIKNGNDTKVRLVAYCMSGTSKLKINLGTNEVSPGDERSVSLSFPAVEGTTTIRVDIEAVDYKHNLVRYSYKNERLYEGTDPGVWTPNPADIVGGGK